MKRPWISLNLAISADGKISSAQKQPSGWTSVADHQRLRELRTGKDALLVGRGTLETDRMSLTVPNAPQPLRCVVSRSGGFDLAQPLFQRPGGEIHLLVTDPPPGFSPGALGVAGATVHTGTLAAFLETLAKDHHVERLHCEGGGELVRQLATLDAIDEIHLTWASHALFGGAEAPTLTGLPAEFLPASRRFGLVDWQPNADGECFLHYRRSL